MLAEALLDGRYQGLPVTDVRVNEVEVFGRGRRRGGEGGEEEFDEDKREDVHGDPIYRVLDGEIGGNFVEVFGAGYDL